MFPVVRLVYSSTQFQQSFSHMATHNTHKAAAVEQPSKDSLTDSKQLQTPRARRGHNSCCSLHGGDKFWGSFRGWKYLAKCTPSTGHGLAWAALSVSWTLPQRFLLVLFVMKYRQEKKKNSVWIVAYMQHYHHPVIKKMWAEERLSTPSSSTFLNIWVKLRRLISAWWPLFFQGVKLFSGSAHCCLEQHSAPASHWVVILCVQRHKSFEADSSVTT